MHFERCFVCFCYIGILCDLQIFLTPFNLGSHILVYNQRGIIMEVNAISKLCKVFHTASSTAPEHVFCRIRFSKCLEESRCHRNEISCRRAIICFYRTHDGIAECGLIVIRIFLLPGKLIQFAC